MKAAPTDLHLPADLDVEAYARGLALQQIQMLTRVAEISLQLAEGAGARALAAQAREAAQAAEAQAAEAQAATAADAPDPAAPPAPAGRDPGLAFTRYARALQHALAQRARAADRLCDRDKARATEREAERAARRDRHRREVAEITTFLIWDEVEDHERGNALRVEAAERIENLYEDEEVRVEDRPVGSVISGLACGLGLAEEWRRWGAICWPGTPRPARPAGSPAAVGAERARRRDAVAAAVRRAFAEVRDPTRIEGLEAGLAVRLQEPDVAELLDTETIATAADRLCRSLGLGRAFDEPDVFDTG